MSAGRVSEVLGKGLIEQQDTRCQENFKMLGQPLQYHKYKWGGGDLPENVKKDLGDDISHEKPKLG